MGIAWFISILTSHKGIDELESTCTGGVMQILQMMSVILKVLD